MALLILEPICQANEVLCFPLLAAPAQNQTENAAFDESLARNPYAIKTKKHKKVVSCRNRPELPSATKNNPSLLFRLGRLGNGSEDLKLDIRLSLGSWFGFRLGLEAWSWLGEDIRVGLDFVLFTFLGCLDFGLCRVALGQT